MSSPVAVHSVRKGLIANGFRFVPVKTGLKRPHGEGWVERARSDEPIPWPDTAALSTGILCDGLVALDLDIEEAATAVIVIQAAHHFLGTAPMRTRSDSSRCLMLYRASEGEPSKRSIVGTAGKIEALGHGQQLVAFGTHPDHKVPYEWTPCAPDTFSRDKLTPVSQDALSDFFGAVAPYIGAEAPVRPTPHPDTLTVLPSTSQTASERDRAYAAKALEAEVAKLSAMGQGSGRNAALNASAHSLGTLAGAGSIEASTVAYALLEASRVNGHIAKHGELQTMKTIESGLNAGIAKPRSTLPVAPDIPMLLGTVTAPNSVIVSKPSATRNVKLIQASQVQAIPVSWLWKGYLPLGKLTLLAGAGGTGKSTLAFSLASTVTRAGAWPDGTLCTAPPGNVIIWSSEDDFADTIKPRMMAVDADEKRYGFVDGTMDENGIADTFDAARDMDKLRTAVSAIGGVRLMIIDPIVTAVTGDMHKANDVRRGLQTIVDFAAEMNCAVLGITHFAKGTAGKNSAERVIGSQAFAALARMVLVAAKEEESDRRVFTRAKSNNSVDTGGFSYTIQALTLFNGIETTRVVWGEALEGSSRSILNDVEGEQTEGTSQMNKAQHFLLDALKHGPVPSKELMEHARELHGISANTCRRAKEELGIAARKAGMTSGWVWQLSSMT